MQSGFSLCLSRLRLSLSSCILQEWTTYDADDIAAGLQEFLICVEMFFAALAHAFSFPPRDYMDPAGTVPKGFKRNIRIMFDVTDVVDDVQGVVDDTVSTYASSAASSNLPCMERGALCSNLIIPKTPSLCVRRLHGLRLPTCLQVLLPLSG